MLVKCIVLLFLLNINYVKNEDNIGQLPFCLENYVPGLALVSTIDGKFSAINSEGQLEWQIDTGQKPLLTSNIHNLELTNNGNWIRIIPSLRGTLYKFDGTTIDPIPITAESLLKSSFRYSDDLVIAGGLEVETYGVGFRSGKIYYTCSSLKCINNTNNDSTFDNILLIERSTQTVRAIETISGNERWNFSVGNHNIKLPHISCSDPNNDLFQWNITAIIPDGLLVASTEKDNVKISWQYHFPSPIVRIWKWNGSKINEIDLFVVKNPDINALLYIGMHKKQLYVHESKQMQYGFGKKSGIVDSNSLMKIPWKPISASGLTTEDDSTALSVLYNSEYVNGNGYYLLNDKKKSIWCKNNNTIRIPILHNKNEGLELNNLLSWWKELIIVIITTIVIFNIMFKTFIHKKENSKEVIFVEKHVEIPKRLSESSDVPFESRFTQDFVTLQCLGKGGFGIVFEVKQKIDECHYAIKRIQLPNKTAKRDAVMREVKALAKLEHNNIVRYFNSWVEKPPIDWHKEHDSMWLNENHDFSSEITSNDVNIDMSRVISADYDKKSDLNEDSFIVFDGDVNSNDSNKTVSEIDSVSTEKSSKMNNSENRGPPVFLYIQMQLCKKESLKDWLADNKTRTVSDILNIFKQIISAVEYVHLQGLIHRDLKPSNIFFSLDGQIKVGDFGLAKDMEDCFDLNTNSSSPLHYHTKDVGTHLYMSPEQLRGEKYNYKVDIYSLGLIFFELLIYFCTDMERICTLSRIRDNQYPEDFVDKHPSEHKLLTSMLCQLPENRLTTFGIRARPPINCVDNYRDCYDFELPKIRN